MSSPPSSHPILLLLVPDALASVAPLGRRAVQERVREMLAEEEQQVDGEKASGQGGEGGGGDEQRRRPPTRRRLTYQELEDVVVRACLVPVGGVPSVEQVKWSASSTVALHPSGHENIIVDSLIFLESELRDLFRYVGELVRTPTKTSMTHAATLGLHRTSGGCCVPLLM